MKWEKRGLHISLLLWNYITLEMFGIWMFTQAGKIMEQKRALERREAQFSAVYGLMEAVYLFSKRGKEILSFIPFPHFCLYCPQLLALCNGVGNKWSSGGNCFIRCIFQRKNLNSRSRKWVFLLFLLCSEVCINFRSKVLKWVWGFEA